MPPHYPSPTELTHLPNEIMLLIGESLGVPALSNMMKTNSRYASLFHSLLHEKAATFNVKGNTPAIAWAAEQGRPSMIKWILDGAKKPITPSAIILALFMACYYNDTDMVEMLLPVTPSVPLCSTNTGAKYFFVGVQSQNMTEKTRNKYVSEDNDLSAHLYVASRNGSEEIVWMLFKFGMRDFAKSRALLAIAEEGLDEAAKILLDAGMKHDPEAVSRAVFSAVIGENVNMVRILMDSGAKFEMPVMAYHTAMRKLTGEMDKVLLQLRDAAHNNFYAIAKRLIESGADISVTDNKDLTPLHLAANNGSYEVARLLLEHGADPWAQSPKGWMPLNLAAIKKHDCVLELLLATQKVAFSIEERERIIRVMGNRYPDF
ncbi:serine/threonine-protein kinase ripk4 [Microsporum canis CBS 113480]|uniref:Serine/threonine-protein kinase ripk4 n=1 Tax=Arthroderma otae (strain ATCC MYA-4605 / CBS 113480) TaxID=554155 RepID=C5FHW2_ARTOC|nr:serine/threonine-protein kinase ripk4 [Microsporum canis CBS 113480]EEQ28942.1 serine/threonine-protein kinase ripk4 [Microsporum canis CBS 113480]